MFWYTSGNIHITHFGILPIFWQKLLKQDETSRKHTQNVQVILQIQRVFRDGTISLQRHIFHFFFLKKERIPGLILSFITFIYLCLIRMSANDSLIILKGLTRIHILLETILAYYYWLVQ